jgi:putative transposase
MEICFSFAVAVAYQKIIYTYQTSKPMLPKGYSKSETSVHFMNYHFVWCAKYRRKVLVGNIEKRLRALLLERVKEIGCKLVSLEIKPDHVHIFLEAQPIHTPNRIVSNLKGYTFRILRQEFPELRTRLPTLWTRSYFVSTYGHVSMDVIKKYVEEQKREV